MVARILKTRPHGDALLRPPRRTAPTSRTCNRHVDCDAAEYDYLLRQGKLPIDFHCHDECCEECFGN